MQFLKNRLRLVGSGQTFPEIIPDLHNPLAQEATNQISFMPYRSLCTHLSVHILAWPQPHQTVILPAEVGLCQCWRKKEQQKEKEGRNDTLVNPTCFWTSKPEVCENHNRKRKARSLHRALEYPMSDFSGGRKIQIGN